MARTGKRRSHTRSGAVFAAFHHVEAGTRRRAGHARSNLRDVRPLPPCATVKLATAGNARRPAGNNPVCYSNWLQCYYCLLASRGVLLLRLSLARPPPAAQPGLRKRTLRKTLRCSQSIEHHRRTLPLCAAPSRELHGWHSSHFSCSARLLPRAVRIRRHRCLDAGACLTGAQAHLSPCVRPVWHCRRGSPVPRAPCLGVLILALALV
jgi:hypothetical protein